MKFEELDEFQKELKKLKKKYKSLDNDFDLFKKVITSVPKGLGRHSAELQVTENYSVIKSRLFFKYLKGNTLRIVFIYFEREKRIVFIEIYFKGDKEREDKNRIKECMKLYI